MSGGRRLPVVSDKAPNVDICIGPLPAISQQLAETAGEADGVRCAQDGRSAPDRWQQEF